MRLPTSVAEDKPPATGLAAEAFSKSPDKGCSRNHAVHVKVPSGVGITAPTVVSSCPLSM